MIFGLLTLFTALAIAGVAAWFSIAGLMAIFSASALSIAIMAGTLEVGKLVTASWLYRNWSQTKFLLKSYLTIAVFVLMFITSMGIFGYLSKAHIEQTASAGDNTLQIELIDNRIARQQRAIDDSDEVISQLDQAVQTLIEYDRIRGDEGSIAVRQGQAEERASLNAIINEAADNISDLQQEKAILASEQLSIEAEVGPLRYIAELIYGEEEAKNHFDQAVRWIIIILVTVFDPLAVALLIAANQTLSRHGIHIEAPDPTDPNKGLPEVTNIPPMPPVKPAKEAAPKKKE